MYGVEAPRLNQSRPRRAPPWPWWGIVRDGGRQQAGSRPLAGEKETGVFFVAAKKSLGGAGPFDSFVRSLSKDELAQDMLQPCDRIQRCRIATLKGCATGEGCPG